jgi:hypothetical protein
MEKRRLCSIIVDNRPDRVNKKSSEGKNERSPVVIPANSRNIHKDKHIFHKDATSIFLRSVSRTSDTRFLSFSFLSIPWIVCMAWITVV